MRKRTKDKHLPPGVYFKHGRYYHVVKGKWHPLSQDLAEALAEYGRRIDPGGGIGYLVDAAVNAADVKESTLKQYRLAAKRIKDAFVEFEPEQVSTAAVVEFLEHYKSIPFMANRMRTVLKISFDRAVLREIVPFNPVTPVPPFKEPPRERYIEDEEYIAIRDNAQPHIALIMDLLYMTGQRVSDIINLKESSIRDGEVYFSQQKTSQKMGIDLTEELAATIEAARGLNRIRGLTLFHKGNGKPYGYTGVRDGFKRACKRAGVKDAQLRDIRAKAATDAEEEGLNPSLLLGHQDPKTTKRYLRKRRVMRTQPMSIRQLDTN